MKERPYGTLAPEMLRNSLGELAAHQTAPSTVLRPYETPFSSSKVELSTRRPRFKEVLRLLQASDPTGPCCGTVRYLAFRGGRLRDVGRPRRTGRLELWR